MIVLAIDKNIWIGYNTCDCKQTRNKQDDGIILNTCCKEIWWNRIKYLVLCGRLEKISANIAFLFYKEIYMKYLIL
jgi:hypothetical protein